VLNARIAESIVPRGDWIARVAEGEDGVAVRGRFIALIPGAGEEQVQRVGHDGWGVAIDRQEEGRLADPWTVPWVGPSGGRLPVDETIADGSGTRGRRVATGRVVHGCLYWSMVDHRRACYGGCAGLSSTSSSVGAARTAASATGDGCCVYSSLSSAGGGGMSSQSTIMSRWTRLFAVSATYTVPWPSTAMPRAAMN
jgi:hypothetical protein